MIDLFNFRLVNILHFSRNDLKRIWKLVKDIRKQFLLNTIAIHPECERYYFLTNDNLNENINILGKRLNVRVSDIIIKNVEEEIFKSAIEMFLYLNHCNDGVETKLFYNLFKEASPKDIILGAVSIIKTHPEKKFLKLIWSKLSTVLNLQNRNIYENSFLINSSNSFRPCTFSNDEDCREIKKTLSISYL